MRQEFSAKTKVQAFALAQGRCQKCTAKLSIGNTEYDHEIPCALGGGNSGDNIVVVCRACHRAKTSNIDMPRIAKAKRNHRAAIGVRRQRSITTWRKMNGDIVRASRER